MGWRLLGILVLALVPRLASSSNGSAEPVHVAPFPVSATGSLLDFPETYGPASVRVVRYGSKADPGRRPEVAVNIGARSTNLSTCLSHLFMQPPNQTILATGIWTDAPSSVLPTLYIQLPYRDGPDGRFDGYSLRFNMESGELLEVRKHQLGSQTDWGRPISEAEACGEDLFGRFAEPAQ